MRAIRVEALVGSSDRAPARGAASWPSHSSPLGIRIVSFSLSATGLTMSGKPPPQPPIALIKDPPARGDVVEVSDGRGKWWPGRVEAHDQQRDLFSVQIDAAADSDQPLWSRLPKRRFRRQTTSGPTPVSTECVDLAICGAARSSSPRKSIGPTATSCQS